MSPDTARRPLGILDTSVVIDLHTIPAGLLPQEATVTTITIAELAVGAIMTDDPVERAVRQRRLQATTADYTTLSFDEQAALVFPVIAGATIAAGRTVRGARTADLFIATIAYATGLPLYTRNAKDFRGIERLVTVVEV